MSPDDDGHENEGASKYDPNKAGGSGKDEEDNMIYVLSGIFVLCCVAWCCMCQFTVMLLSRFWLLVLLLVLLLLVLTGAFLQAFMPKPAELLNHGDEWVHHR